MKKVQLTAKQEGHLYELAVKLYETNGQEAAEKLGGLFGLDESPCDACEATTPHISKGTLCLVCGTSKRDTTTTAKQTGVAKQTGGHRR